MNANTWILVGVIATAVAAFAIPYGFYKKSKVGEDSSPSSTIILSSFKPDISLKYNPPLGLAWDGNFLWTSVGRKGKKSSRLYKISANDGSLISAFDYPGLSLHGIAWGWNYIWTIDSPTKSIYKIDPVDGNVVNTLASLNVNGNAHGLTFDGGFLWVACSSSDMLYKINPDNGSIVYQVKAPNVAWGLAWDGKYIWNSDPKLNLIYCLDPANGKVIAKYASPGSYPNGLTWVGSDLWVVDTKRK